MQSANGEIRGVLKRKHDEHYSTEKEVLRDIEFVMKSPDDWFVHKDSRGQ